MKIAIVGIINHDTITMADGQELQDLGGILYNTAVLANLVDASVLLFPISRIGDDCRPMMEKVLAPYPNVETSGIATSSEGTSRNTIRYDDQMEKIEQLTNHIRPVSFDQIEPFLDCDAVLVNFIIGDDISLADLASLNPAVNFNNLRIGQALFVPDIDLPVPPQPARAPTRFSGPMQPLDLRVREAGTLCSHGGPGHKATPAAGQRWRQLLP